MVVFVRYWLAVIAVLTSFGTVAGAVETVTVGVLAHRGEDAAISRWAETISYLNSRLPEYNFQLLPLSLEGVQATLENDGIEFLLTNPGHFHAVSDRFRLSRIASLKTDRRGEPLTGNRYGAVIFVRAERDDIRTIGDLKGQTFAAVAPDAFGGFLAAAQVFQRNGLDPYSGFKTIKFMGFPQDAIVEAVMRGEADAGTVRTGVLESMVASGKISATDFRILNPQVIDGFELMLSTQLFPEWVFAASGNTQISLRKKVAQALFAMAEASPAATKGQYGGWNTPMFDGSVRRLVENAAADDAGDHVTRDASILIAVLVFVVALIVLVYRYFGHSILTGPGGKKDMSHETEFQRLTPRENQVLGHVVSGKTNKEIARELNISPKTVEFHRKHMMKKLQAESIADLVRIAVERENSASPAKT